MIAIHMHYFCDLYAKLRASWCSIHDARDAFEVRMKHGGKERTTRLWANETIVIEMVSTKKKRKKGTL